MSKGNKTRFEGPPWYEEHGELYGRKVTRK